MNERRKESFLKNSTMVRIFHIYYFFFILLKEAKVFSFYEIILLEEVIGFFFSFFMKLYEIRRNRIKFPNGSIWPSQYFDKYPRENFPRLASRMARRYFLGDDGKISTCDQFSEDQLW